MLPQALSIKHLVIGCLDRAVPFIAIVNHINSLPFFAGTPYFARCVAEEGVFAMGQVYVLISRALRLVFSDRRALAILLCCAGECRAEVTDPQNMLLVGIPPKDLIPDVAQALIAAGLDPDQSFVRACEVTQAFGSISYV